MTNNNHPITPPPELVKQWIRQYGNSEDPRWQAYEQDIATQAARWGADQELDACCEILRGEFNYHHLAEPLRDARRPKPPSLKEQALEALDRMDQLPTAEDHGVIRRALEALPD